MSVKVYIPSPPPEVKCSYIERIIGPNGMTIRDFQRETGCQLSIRGIGSVKDSKRLLKIRCRPGFEHLREDTHVFIEAESSSRAECLSLIEKARKRISEMFTPEYDALKREQLIHLAVLKGTHKPNFLPRSTGFRYGAPEFFFP